MAYAKLIGKVAQGVLGAFELQAHDRLVRETGHVFSVSEIGNLDADINRRFGR